MPPEPSVMVDSRHSTWWPGREPGGDFASGFLDGIETLVCPWSDGAMEVVKLRAGWSETEF